MLWSGGSWFFLWSPVSPVCFPGLWRLFLGFQLHSVSLSHSWFMFYSFFNALAKSMYLFITLFSFIFTLWSTGWQNPQDDKLISSCKLIHYHFIPSELFTPALSNGLSLKSEPEQFNNAEVWTISACPPVSNSSSPLN